MAFATTTNSAAVAVNDTSINLASATSVAPGRLMRVNGEMMQVAQSYSAGTLVPVLRGRDGTKTVAHPISSNVTHGLASDFATPPDGTPQAVTNPAQPAFPLFSYSATGAITPVQGIHVLNGSTAIPMTLAAPTKDQDGQELIIVGNGKAAHTVTNTGGIGAGGTVMDTLTWAAGAQIAIRLIAAAGVWVPYAVMAGASNANVTITAS